MLDVAGTNNAGDINTDDLLNPGETWQFSCTAVINEDTLNVAGMQAQPVGPSGPIGDPLIRAAVDLVQVVDPAIQITKTALVPVVLDPDATPVAGPDVPTPRPAEYLYEVANPGTVPLSDVDGCRRPVRTADASSTATPMPTTSSMSTRCGPTPAPRRWIETRPRHRWSAPNRGWSPTPRRSPERRSCRVIPR